MALYAPAAGRAWFGIGAEAITADDAAARVCSVLKNRLRSTMLSDFDSLADYLLDHIQRQRAVGASGDDDATITRALEEACLTCSRN
jgi:hypothetical protein